MHVYILTKDLLEAQGIKWMITSQMRDVPVETSDSISTLREDIFSKKIDFFIIDMDLWPDFEETILPKGAVWLGMSSDRTFQTAYRALKHKAENLLFRPFQPEHLIKHVQQARFQLRNNKMRSSQIDSVQETMLTYEDLLLTETYPNYPVLMSAIVPSDREEGSHLVRALKEFSFPTNFDVFPFSDFVLVVHRLGENMDHLDAYRVFFSAWKRQSDALLSIYLYESLAGKSTRMLY